MITNVALNGLVSRSGFGRYSGVEIASRKREHSRKPDELYPLIEACSPGPFLELFARGSRTGWTQWGNEADGGYRPTWRTYRHNSASGSATQLEEQMPAE